MTMVLASKASFTADLEGNYYFVGGGNAKWWLWYKIKVGI